MSVDFDFIFPCQHVNGEFRINNCPVCIGTGFYFDAFLNQKGEPQQVKGVNKAVQEIVHLFYHDQGQFTDYGYPEYGSKTVKFVGAKNVTQLRIKFHVLRDLQYLNFLKEGQQKRFGNVDSSEIIQRIVAVKTTDDVDTQAVELSVMIGDSDTLQAFNIRKFQF